MKVYRLRSDVNHYRYFLPEREEDALALEMDCTPKEETWVPPPVFIYEPMLKAGDFYQFEGSKLITTLRATEVLEEFLEMAGELLPLPYGGEVYTVLNVLECINCLDHERTQWRLGPDTGEKLGPRQYAFHPDRFSESPLFKIPETCRSQILLVEGLRDPEEEFRYVVENAGLNGLVFEELWDSET
jgi:hypothetical protein